MKNTKEIILEIEKGKLICEGDCIGFDISNKYAMYIEVQEDIEGKYYFIELNEILDDGCYEPLESVATSNLSVEELEGEIEMMIGIPLF